MSNVKNRENSVRSNVPEKLSEPTDGPDILDGAARARAVEQVVLAYASGESGAPCARIPPNIVFHSLYE